METVTKDDVERVEILLGPNGPYTDQMRNGLVNTITKNPFKYQELLCNWCGNHVVTAIASCAGCSDKSLINSILKITGTEFNYTDSVYVGTKAYKELELDRKFDTQNMVPDYFIN
jgi:iron complex outermembrane receptor protein